MTNRLLKFAAALVVSLALHVGAASAMSHTEWVALKHCEQGRVLSCIHRAAIHRHQSYSAMRAVAWCESRLRPWATNPSGAAGVFQIIYPGTWRTTPYAARSPYSAKWNALAAAWMWQQGRRDEWVC